MKDTVLPLQQLTQNGCRAKENACMISDSVSAYRNKPQKAEFAHSAWTAFPRAEPLRLYFLKTSIDSKGLL